MDSTFALVAVIVIIALTFDYTNGFHDAANSIATVVSTRVLSPARAMILAAFFNFIAFFLGTHAVAKTVYSGLVNPKQINEWVVLAGLIGAVTWNLITWYLGLPTSSSHALIGGYAGAAMANAGFRARTRAVMKTTCISPTVCIISGPAGRQAMLSSISARAIKLPSGCNSSPRSIICSTANTSRPRNSGRLGER